MIARAPLAIRRWRALGLAALAPLLLWTSCDKIPLFAPTQSTITLFATQQTLPLNGRTEIIGTVIEQAGTPAHNGTLVVFRSTLGTVDPPEARTQNGKVTVRFNAGTRSGTAVVNAVSGANTSADIEIRIGGALVERIELNASAGTVPSGGGTVQLVALVTDVSGNPLPDIPVTFSADAGTLSVTSAVTDASGQARTSLTTNRDTIVTARAAGKEATRTIRVHQLPTVTITADTANPIEGDPVTFTITVTAASGGAAIRDVRIDYGDDVSESLGTIVGTTRAVHVYRAPGTYRVTVTVTDAINERQTATTSVNVGRLALLNITLTASSLTPQINQPVTFTATVTPATVQIREYQWNFGDGNRAVTNGNQRSHVYSSTGHKAVTVTAVPVVGPPVTTSLELVVQPAPPGT